jgi:hypothetical protein
MSHAGIMRQATGGSRGDAVDTDIDYSWCTYPSVCFIYIVVALISRSNAHQHFLKNILDREGAGAFLKSCDEYVRGYLDF